jgi:chorismate dehydratase
MRLGVVSFLNSRPLIEGLDGDPRVSLAFDVPSRLADRLAGGEVDVALVPIVDVLRSAGALHVVSDACIGCDGETMTVRVFSQVPPHRITTLWVDGDSHTSIALATVLWRELFGQAIELRPFDARRQKAVECDSVLLIGDKVVRSRFNGFAYEVDLGGAWRSMTGLPFVFAVWAARADGLTDERRAEISELLSVARDRGLERGREIAERDGPPRWWPVDLAVRYLTHSLRYRLDERYMEGADRFAALCVQAGLVPVGAGIRWPGSVQAVRPA